MKERDSAGKPPLVSVVIPAYKAARWIGEALDSVLDQTFKEYEIIVVNDGSPDAEELEGVLDRYRGQVVYIRQENRGLAGARNTGILAAQGKYIAPLDADDVWLPEHLAAQIAVLEADPAITMVYADARIIGDVPEAGKTVMDFCPSTGEVTFERLVSRECTVHVCVSVCRRDALLRAGLFDPNFRRNEDIDMWLRIARQGDRIAYQRRVLGCYRRHGGSLSSDEAAMLEGYLAVLAKAARDPGLTAVEREAIDRQCAVENASLELELGKKAFRNGDPETAIRHLARANATRKSLRLAAIVMLLQVAPGLVRALYAWRNRHIFKLKTQS